MHVRSATKVGLSVLTSLTAFGLISFFLLGRGFKENRYPLDVVFKDAQNLTAGSDVYMAGVQIGSVSKITLDEQNRAVLHLLIDRQYKVPLGSRFIITAGGFIGEKFVSILPKGANSALTAGMTVQGEDTVKIEDLMAKANAIASSSNKIIAQALLTLEDSRKAIQSVSKLVSDPRLQTAIYGSLANVEAASKNVQNITLRGDHMASQFEQLTRTQSPRIDRAMASVEKSASNVQEFTDALNGLVNGQNLQGDLGATFKNFRKSTEQLPVITAHLEKITANMERLTGDTKITDDLKATLANVKLTSEQALEASQAVNQTLQRVTARFRRPRNSNGTAGGAGGSRSLSPEFSADVLQSVDPARFRLDVNGTVGFGQGQFVYAGLRGLGEYNRLNLQMGQTMDNGWSGRYGIYGGRLGIGLDQHMNQADGWSLNLYDPNRLKADLYARKKLNANTSLTVGVERVFQNPTPTVGIRIRK